MSKDLFAPPSKEEVERAKMFAPPSEAELKSVGGVKPLTATPVEKVGKAVAGFAGKVASGAKAFFAGDGPSLGESAPIIGPLGRVAGEGFRAAIEGGLSSKETVPEAFKRIRGENDAKAEKFAKENPGADFARKLVGGVGGAGALPVIGAGAAGLAGAAARVAGSAGTVAADTALRGGDVLQAATLGGGLQAAAEAIPAAGKLAGPLARTVKGSLDDIATKADKVAAVRAVKAALGNSEKEWTKLGSRVKESGDLLLGEKAVRFGSGAGAIARRAGKAGKDAWSKVESVFKAADDAGVMIDGKEVADEILVAAQKIDPVGKSRNVAEGLVTEASDIQKLGQISLAKAQELKNRFRYKVMDSRTHALGEDGNNIVNQAFARSIKRKGSEIAPDFVQNYEKSGALGGLAAAARKTETRFTKNRGPFSLTDYIAGGSTGAAAAALSGDPKEAGAIGFAAAFANGLARKRGNAALATSMKGLSRVLQQGPERLGKAYQALEQAAQTSPAAFALAHEILLQQDPKYRDAVLPKEEQGAPSAMPIAPENAINRRVRRLSE